MRVVTDNEPAIESAPSPPRLDYAQQPAWHRRALVRRIALGIAIAAAFGITLRFGNSAVRRVQLIYWQNQCLDYQPSGETALEIDSISTTRRGSIPVAWSRFYAMASPPGLRSDGTLFLGRMRTPAGDERLIGVDLQRDVTMKNRIEIIVRMFEPGSIMRRPIENRITTFDDRARFDIERSGRFDRADRDAGDPTHFIAEYEIDGTKGVIDGWITGDNTVVIEQRKQD